MENKQVHLFIEGCVQGVGFRHFTTQTARSLDLTGWVRNTYKGEVEVIAEGPRGKLDQLINEVRQGPSSAFVSNVRIEWDEPSEKFNKFQVAPST